MTSGVSGPVFTNALVIAGFPGLVYESWTDNIVAATAGSQQAATPLTTELNRVTTAVAGASVVLPASQTTPNLTASPGGGLTVIVENASANPIQVYGLAGDTINGVAAATGISQMAGSVVIYTSYTPGAWFANGLGTGYFGSFETMSFTNNIPAAGASQNTATPLTTMLNVVGTVAAGTGVNLPASAGGMNITVVNSGVNALTVYPAQNATDTINGQAASVGVQLLPGTVATFVSAAAGAWEVQPATTHQAASNTVASAASVTLTAAQVTGGGSTVDLTVTGSTAITTFTTPTATQIIATLHSPTVGTSWRLRIICSGTSSASALLGGTGVTVSSPGGGVETIAAATWREWVVTVTNIGTPAVTMQSVATGTWS
jgi:hypothetical protein